MSNLETLLKAIYDFPYIDEVTEDPEWTHLDAYVYIGKLAVEAENEILALIPSPVK